MKNKIKKKIKIRKNSIDDYYVYLLALAYNHGDPNFFTDAITYYKQGRKCDDCEKHYTNCECEKCPDCEFNRCLCDLGLTTKKSI